MKFLKDKSIKLFAIAVGVLVIIIIIISLASNKRSETADERALTKAAQRYFNENEILLPKNNYESATVILSTLVSSGYIKSKDSCFSYVTVIKSNDEYIYNPYVKCNNDYDTKLLADIITSSVTTENDGIYKINDEYIYKGENPNNVIEFSGELWRIVKMTKDGVIKIIYDDNDSDSNAWDDRFNINTNNNTGINDYAVSRIYSYLQSYIKDNDNYTNTERARLIPTDICIGKRSLQDKTVDGSTECLKKKEKQVIGLLQPNEYFNASNDPNCSAVSQVVCQNYNYLAGRAFWTIAGVEENTYQAFRIHPDIGLQEKNAKERVNVLPVLYLRNDTVITEGTGTEENPYILR